MMMNKRLIQSVPKAKQYIAINVLLQWCSLVANIILMFSIAQLLARAYEKILQPTQIYWFVMIALLAIIIRFFCMVGSTRMGYLSSRLVKKDLRNLIYQKLLNLGSSYNENIKTSEVVQVASEGVEQLETYFSAYLPQFFYSMLAPITLFVTLSFINFPSALILLVCVPLIPISIAAVQTWAKKLLAKYWGQYTTLGDTFLENLQGLTTLKIYQADAYKNKKMNEEAQKFRQITMKVLTMQLNSITIMDLIAYGGAALGMILAITQYLNHHVSLSGALLIILLAADFFLPMRLLGSFFHIAMNGMAASDKIFDLLDIEEPATAHNEVPQDLSIHISNLSFSYDSSREILHDLDMNFLQGSFSAIVGKSGCGKSTISTLLLKKNQYNKGSITIGNIELNEIKEASLLQAITYVGHQSYLFKGTVRENLLMANPTANDDELWKVLDKVNLTNFLRGQQGLDTLLLEKASNLSGGQRQRLSLARALLHDSPIYIFDEATSNIDIESENNIMEQILDLAKTKTIILISHRLANVTQADTIYVLDQGKIIEKGTHSSLLHEQGYYQTLWDAQQALETFRKDSR